MVGLAQIPGVTTEGIQAYANANNIPYHEAVISLSSQNPQAAQAAVGNVLGSNNMYGGTINGKSALVNQSNLQNLDPGSVTSANVSGSQFNTSPIINSANSGGLGNYANYNGVGISKDAYNAMVGTEHGGTLTKNDTGMSGLDMVNAGVGLGGLAANIYYADKNYQLQKDAQDYSRQRDAQSDARKAKFAQGVGGSY